MVGTSIDSTLTVADLMSRQVQMIHRDDSVAAAIAHMRTFGVRSLIVDRLADNLPYGIITERDIVYRVLARGGDPARVRVHDIMRQPCIAFAPTLTLKAAAQLFSDTGTQRAPVMAEHQLLGIISVTDLVMKTAPQDPPWPPVARLEAELRGAE